MDPNRALQLQLAYAFIPAPNPIRASLPGSNPNHIDLQVVISNPTMDEINFKLIQIEIPVGDDIAADLSSEPKLPDPDYDTSGKWKIEINPDETDSIRIQPKNPGEAISGEPIIFTIPGIKTNTKPGTVMITVAEDDTLDSDTYSLVKQPSEFPVTEFWADPAILDDLDRPSILYWNCDAVLGPKYTYNLRKVDESWKSNNHQWNEGVTGIATSNLLADTLFALDVVKADPSGHPTIIGTVNTKVTVDHPEISQDSYMEQKPNHFYELHWLTSNTARCDLWLDDHPFMYNVPIDTYHQGYFVYAADGDGTHYFTLAAYGKSEQVITRHQFPDFQMSKSTSTFIPIQNKGFTEWIAITRDGTLAIMGNVKNNSVYLFDVPGRCQKGDAIGVNDVPNRVAITPDNKFALVACINAMIVLNIANHSVEATISMGDGKAKSIAVTPDGQYALLAQSTDSTNRVSIINIPGWSVASSILLEEHGESFGIAITPDSKLALIIDPYLNYVTAIDINSCCAEPQKIPVGTGPSDIAITPDGKYALVVGSVENSITVINIANRSLEPKIFLGDDGPRGITISKDGRLAFVTYLSIIMIIDIARRLVVSRIPLNKHCLATGIVLTPDDSVILVSGFGGVEFIY